MSNNTEPLTGKQDGKYKDAAEKLRTFAKNVSVEIINQATDKKGNVDKALIIAGIGLAMDVIFDVMSQNDRAKKAVIVSQFCRTLIENI